MDLPDDDLSFLQELGLPWNVVPDGDQAGFLVVDDYDVSKMGFAPAKTTLMIRTPPLYSSTPLDMWYCDPPIKRNGVFPDRADVIENHMGRQWQRFSRHLNGTGWIPGIDGLRSYFKLIEKEIGGGR